MIHGYGCGHACDQCFGSGSVSAWIRIKFVSWIRIRIQNADPDPAAEKLAPKAKLIHII
jgi:hypothetical protein